MGGSFRERFGNDEIYLATIGADTSGTHKQPFFEVYGNFDDGDVKRYSPPRPLVTVSAEGQAVLMLAERQLGGMNEALDTADKKLA